MPRDDHDRCQIERSGNQSPMHASRLCSRHSKATRAQAVCPDLTRESGIRLSAPYSAQGAETANLSADTLIHLSQHRNRLAAADTLGSTVLIGYHSDVISSM